jgi:hypothetical protein
LPAKYNGHDLASLYERLTKAVGKKDAFETTSQYSSRVAAAINNDLYAFKLDSASTVRFEYDADRRTLTVVIPTGRVNDYQIDSSLVRGRWSSGTGIKVREGSYDFAHYVGSNAYGVTKDVTSIRGDDYELLLDNYFERNVNLIIGAPMDPDHAREVFPKLGLLVICRTMISHLAPAITFESVHGMDATTDSPVASYIHSKYTVVDLVGLWVYNSVSGEILWKVDMSDKVPFEYWRVDIFDNHKGDFMIWNESDPMSIKGVGEVIQGRWRIDVIDENQAEVTDIRSGLHHIVPRRR